MQNIQKFYPMENIKLFNLPLLSGVSNMSSVDSNAPQLLLRCLIYLVKGDKCSHFHLRQDLCDGSCECCLAMINMT